MKKENLPILVGLMIPVLLVVVLAAVIYVPRLYTKPSYDFVYAVGTYPVYYDIDSGKRIEYVVIDGVLSTRTGDTDIKRDWEASPQFYRYDVKNNKNIKLSVDEVAKIRLDPKKISPDGFKYEYGSDSDNIFEAMFDGGRDYSTRVLEKGSVAVNLELIAVTGRYSYERQEFVGWVIE